MEEIDGKVLNAIQRGFPLEERPYFVLASKLAVAELKVMERIRALRQQKMIRQISAIFDTRSLGYKSCLVAAKVAPKRTLEAARVFNAHPGVSHNYERESEFNLWFTIATPPAADIEAVVRRLGDLAGVSSIRMLPTLRLFKIGVALDVAGEDLVTATSEPQYSERERLRAQADPITDRDKAVIKVVQEDLPLLERPFHHWAAASGMSAQELLDKTRELGHRGHMRRFAAILFHRKAGFTANCMAVWQIPEDRVLEAGERMAEFSAVSHCYQRPTYADWPYNIFTMIHGRSKSECEQVIQAIARDTSPVEVARIYSTREFKKTRVRYFTPEFDEWERVNMSGAAAGLIASV